ncbi:hypothetical protein GCK32_020013, partial [Trichostrongylus colubriformis]
MCSDCLTRTIQSWVGGLLIGASEITSVFLAFNPKVAIRELGGAFTTARISDLIDEQGRMKLNRGAVIVGATFQRCEKHTRVFTFKQGLRPGADSTVVNCVGVFRVEHFIETARIAVSFGSHAVLSEKVSQRLRGKRHDELVDHVDEFLEALEEDISQFSSIPDFSYRRQLGRAAISSMCEDLCRRSTPADEFSGDYLQLYTV